MNEVEHQITHEDLAENPELVEAGGEVGEIVGIPAEEPAPEVTEQGDEVAPEEPVEA